MVDSYQGTCEDIITTSGPFSEVNHAHEIGSDIDCDCARHGPMIFVRSVKHTGENAHTYA